MSKAGSKIIKGLKEAHAVVKGEGVPVDVTAVGDAETASRKSGALDFVQHVFDAAIRKGKAVKVSVHLQFPGDEKPKKEKRAHGRKS